MTDATQIRVPPHNAEAERSVIGGLMLDERAFDVAADIVGEDDFYLARHRTIFAAIRGLAKRGEPFDAVTLVDQLTARGTLDDVGGAEYLYKLASNTPSAANVDAYARIVRDRAVLRQLAQIGQGIVTSAFEADGRSAEEVLAAAQSSIMSAGSQRGDAGLKQSREVCKLWYQQFIERYESGGGISGLETPWEELTAVTNGLQAGDLIVLAARPGMGKTLMALQLAAHVALADKPVAVFELEMGGAQLVGRSLSALARIPYSDLKRAALDDEQYPSLTGAMKRLAGCPLWIDDTPGLSSDTVVSRARRLHTKTPLQLIVIDHLQLMRHARERGRTDAAAIGDTTRDLKGLAKQLGCAVVLLSQLNRNLEGRGDKRPTMADLRDSGSIEQDADLVLFLYRDDYYHADSHMQGVVELKIGKNRDGEAGGTIYLENRFGQMRLDPWTRPLPQPPERSTGSGRKFKASGNGATDRIAP